MEYLDSQNLISLRVSAELTPEKSMEPGYIYRLGAKILIHHSTSVITSNLNSPWTWPTFLNLTDGILIFL